MLWTALPRDVRAAERDLRELNSLQQTIEASASISCPREVHSMLPILMQTRESFDRLQRALVTQLTAAHMDKLKRELGGRAQCAVDVLVRLDDVQPLERSVDPIIAEALQSSGDVERFGSSDLGTPNHPALLFAHRIMASAHDRSPIGVLVLRFRFETKWQQFSVA